MARRRPYQLKRSDIRRETDEPTRSIILRYVGNALDFDEYLYGYPDDAFFAIQLDELPWPESLEELSEELGVAIDPLPEAPRLRRAVADALAAGALVDAPMYMEQMGVHRDVEWPSWQRRDLEREHRIAETKVAELCRLISSDMKLRAAGFKKPSFEVPKVEDFMGAPPPLHARSSEPVVVEREVVEVASGDPSCEGEADGAYEPASATVRRVMSGVRVAREQELPQRLPGGMRRRLGKMPPAVYLMYSEQMEPRVDLCAAITDARAMSRADREVVVVDYDGEWPVVARRYGQDGRTIYKVEDALRRYGIEVPKDDAP